MCTCTQLTVVVVVLRRDRHFYSSGLPCRLELAGLGSAVLIVRSIAPKPQPAAYTRGQQNQDTMNAGRNCGGVEARAAYRAGRPGHLSGPSDHRRRQSRTPARARSWSPMRPPQFIPTVRLSLKKRSTGHPSSGILKLRRKHPYCARPRQPRATHTRTPPPETLRPHQRINSLGVHWARGASGAHLRVASPLTRFEECTHCWPCSWH